MTSQASDPLEANPASLAVDTNGNVAPLETLPDAGAAGTRTASHPEPNRASVPPTRPIPTNRPTPPTRPIPKNPKDHPVAVLQALGRRTDAPVWTESYSYRICWMGLPWLVAVLYYLHTQRAPPETDEEKKLMVRQRRLMLLQASNPQSDTVTGTSPRALDTKESNDTATDSPQQPPSHDTVSNQGHDLGGPIQGSPSVTRVVHDALPSLPTEWRSTAPVDHTTASPRTEPTTASRGEHALLLTPTASATAAAITPTEVPESTPVSESATVPTEPVTTPPPLPPLAPPIQLLCLTLSDLFAMDVSSHAKAKPWGGDWRPSPPRKPPQHQARTLVLDVESYHTTYPTGSWTDLLAVVQHVFATTAGPITSSTAVSRVWSTTLHLVPSVGSRNGNPTKLWEDVTWVRHVLGYHNRLTEMVRHGKYPTMVKLWMANNHKILGDTAVSLQPLADCLMVIRSWLVHHLVREVQPFLHHAIHDCDAEYDEPVLELFADDYGVASQHAVSSSTPSYLQLTSPLDVLPSLLESSSRVNSTDDFVSTEFMEEYLLQVQQLLSNAKTQDPGTEHVKAAPANSTADAARLLLQRCIDRVDAALHTPHQFQHVIVTARILAVSTLLSLSPSTRAIVPHALCGDTPWLESQHGRGSFKALWETAAYVVPAVGSEQYGSNDPKVKTPFYQHLDASDDFPLSFFRKTKQSSFRGSKPQRNEVQRVLEESHVVMSRARMTVQSLLRVAFKYGDKHNVFQWMSDVIRQHESLVSLIKSNMLDTDLKSSRQFLLGFSSSLICYSHASLSKRLLAGGAAAFDVSFIRNGFQGSYLEPVNDTNRLFQGYASKIRLNDSEKNAPEHFDGATRFFFLTCLCLRVAVRTAFRTEMDFHQKNRPYITHLQKLSKSDVPSTYSASLTAFKPVMSAYVGWLAYFGDPDAVNAVTEVTLVQLGWLAAIGEGAGANDLSIVPDWMCREPARWISYMADRVTHLLKPTQADRAVVYATQLLDLGASGGSNKSRFTFSPIVTSALIDIISSFVQTSVRRATQKAKAKQIKTSQPHANNPEDKDVDIYSSFDSNDSGVTVFTNELVRRRLCPTLVRTFVDSSVVEGFDVEKDDAFNQFGERSKIALLICRLWFHPSGKFRESFDSISEKDLFAFGSSVAKGLAVDLNFGLESLTSVFTHKKQNHGTSASQRSAAMTIHWSAQGSRMLLGARRFLWLLCSISHNDRVAKCFGGSFDCFDKDQFPALSSMLLHILEILTAPDGGTKGTLEDRDVDPTSKYMDPIEFSALSIVERRKMIHDVVRRRITSRVEYGLDIGNLCHVVFALFARWHFAAAKENESGRRISPLVEAVAGIEDWDQARAKAVFERLVVVHEVIDGNELDNYEAILRSDGHVDHQRWENNYVKAEVADEQQNNRHTAANDQIKSSEINELASTEVIKMFLVDLEAAIPERAPQQRVDVSRTPELESSLFSSENTVSDEDTYATALSEWQVSSDTFASSHGNTFAHYFDKVARNRGLAGSGKTLVNEARRCKKLLPDPSSNSAIYICFAEERMDLCRAIVTGPMDTPYAHGLFVFDIYFPPSYSFTPPMVTFMTTGGGRVRFNPNLYVDGKVCLSLLGSTDASDQSQRWDKDLSSLAQVLLSIQSQILGVEEPYYNEGNGMPLHLKGTREGNAGSQAYNRDIRMGTLRHAMIDVLRRPPLGFEEVVHRHFALCRQRVAMQSKRWMVEAAMQAQHSKRHEDESVHKRFAQIHADLLVLLTENPAADQYPSLKPLAADVKVVAIADPSVQKFLDTKEENVKLSAPSGIERQPDRDEQRRLVREQRLVALQRQQTAVINPWAQATGTAEPKSDSTEKDSLGYTSDGDLYE